MGKDGTQCGLCFCWCPHTLGKRTAGGRERMRLELSQFQYIASGWGNAELHVNPLFGCVNFFLHYIILDQISWKQMLRWNLVHRLGR